MKILLTGFEPFGGNNINPSWEAVKRVSDKIEDYEVVKAEIKVTFAEAGKQIISLLDKEKPDVLLMVGQRGGCCDIECERIAINMAYSVKADNNGYIPNEEPIIKKGPAAYFGTFPVLDIVKALREDGIPALPSNSAGTYVCNYIYYNALHHSKKSGICKKVGFIHIPFLPEQALEGRKAFMTLDMTTRALNIALKTIVKV